MATLAPQARGWLKQPADFFMATMTAVMREEVSTACCGMAFDDQGACQ